MTEIIKDVQGRSIGSIRSELDRLVARDRNGNRIAYYDRRADTTKTLDGTRIGAGNLLRDLVLRASGVAGARMAVR